MNAQNMLDLLALRLEDPDKIQFTDSFKLSTLDDAQIMVAMITDREFLTEIQVIDAAETVTSGVAALSALSYDTLNGIMGLINVRNSANGYYCHRLGLKHLKRMENSYMVSSALNPMFLPYANNIYIHPTSITSADVHYIKTPSPLRHAFTIASGATTTFTANGSQGLSTTADVYNGSVIYNISENTYHIVTDLGTSLDFTVSPAASSWSGDTFYFVTGDFKLINLTSVTCELNVALHETVVALAEVECWKAANKLDRAQSALKSAIEMLQAVASQKLPVPSIGSLSTTQQSGVQQ